MTRNAVWGAPSEPAPSSDGTNSTVQRLLDATREELNAVGVGRLRTRSVATRAGVSLGTVTHYFPTRRDLLEAVLDEFQREAWTVFEAHRTGGAPHLASMDVPALVVALIELCRARRELVRARLHLTAQTGRLSDENWRGSLRPLLDELGPIGGMQMRLRGHTLFWLLMRYALHSDDELCAVCGCTSPQEARAAVVTHLTRVAVDSGL